MKGYKFVTKDLKSKEGNCQWEIGKWKHENEIKLCQKGLHACRTALQSLQYVYGDKWFIVEAKGKMKEEKGDKFVATDMRLVKEIPIDNIVKRFSLFCAKDCLKNYEKKYPNDKRVSDCIKATEDYLDGKITLRKLDAARSAARSATRSAAWSAESATRSAARSAESAAESAESAARSAESAAESAESARSAAWSAAESAGSAAESAAWSAEGAAESAWSAAKKRQEKELNRLIEKELGGANGN
jgi:hypothetical protein